MDDVIITIVTGVLLTLESVSAGAGEASYCVSTVCIGTAWRGEAFVHVHTASHRVRPGALVALLALATGRT